jgi:general secretion pathway protein H
LLVLVIVALIVTIAGLSVTSGSRPYTIAGAVRVFADIAETAMDEAALTGSDLGLLLEERDGPEGPAYSFVWLQRVEGGWRDGMLDPDIFGRQRFPADVELRLQVEEGDELLDAESTDEDEETLRPQVIFYNSGEATPGLISVRDVASGELLWEVEWDLVGRVELRRGGIREEQ